MKEIDSIYFEHYYNPFIYRMPAYSRVLGAKIQPSATGEPLYIDIEVSGVLGGENEQKAGLFAVLTTSDLIPPGAVFVCKIETPYDWKDARYLYEIPDELPF